MGVSTSPWVADADHVRTETTLTDHLETAGAFNLSAAPVGGRPGAEVAPEEIGLSLEMLRQWVEGDENPRTGKGTVLVVGGSVESLGTVVLAALGALRAGAARVQVATVASAAASLAIAVPEARVIQLPMTAAGDIDADQAVGALRELINRADSVLVGPGLMDTNATVSLVSTLLPKMGQTGRLTLQGSALDAFPRLHRTVTRALHGRVILTPSDEQGMFLALDETRTLRIAKRAVQIANRFNAVVAFSDGVSAPGRNWASELEPNGVVSGSGEVLAGLVSGMAARYSDPALAACLASWVHRTSCERVVTEVGPVGYLAREILDRVPGIMASVLA